MSKAPQVVFRIAKLKSYGNIEGAAAHNQRTRPAPNATSKGQGIIEIVAPAPGVSVSEHIKDVLSEQTVRKNAVLAVEVVISTSPEYFRPGNESKGGTWDAERLSDWRQAMEPWIAKEFPHAASVVLHLDEETPHYQIIDVPLDSKGKLSARSKFGGENRREGLSAWQDKAAQPVKALGIERGTRGSVAEHTDIKAFYSAVNSPTPKISAMPTPQVPGLFARDAKSLESFAISERKLTLQTFRPTLNSALAKATRVDVAEKKQREAEAGLAKKDEAYQRQKAIADELRALPLIEVLKTVYKATESLKSKPKYASREFEIGNRQVAVTDNKWIEQGGKGGAGAINLVMHLEGVDYKAAVSILSEHFSTAAVGAEHARTLVARAKQEVEKMALETTPAPVAHESNWQRVKSYLLDKRALPEQLIDTLKSQGRIYADTFANCVFPRMNSGAFVRGTSSKVHHRAYGKKAAGAYVLPAAKGSNRILLCEGAMDALALRAIDPDAKIIATGGNLLTMADLKSLIPPGSKVHAAFDSDTRGEELAKEAAQLYGAERLRPKGKDWSQDLAARPRELIHDAWQDKTEVKVKTKANSFER